MESDIPKEFLWVSKLKGGQWECYFFFREIKAVFFFFVSYGAISFSHIAREAIFIIDLSAKQGVKRAVSLFASIL